jgi:hypothetical protein
MGHCDEFIYALWATVANLVICYAGHYGQFSYALRATAVDFVLHYGRAE